MVNDELSRQQSFPLTNTCVSGPAAAAIVDINTSCTPTAYATYGCPTFLLFGLLRRESEDGWAGSKKFSATSTAMMTS